MILSTLRRSPIPTYPYGWAIGWLLWNLPIKEPQRITHHVCCRSLGAVYDTWAAIMARVMVCLLATRGAATCPALVPWLLAAYHGHEHVTTTESGYTVWYEWMDMQGDIYWVRGNILWKQVLAPGRCGSNFKNIFFNRIAAWLVTEKLLSGECHRTSLIRS